MAPTLDSLILAAEQEGSESLKQGPTRLRWTKMPLQVGDRAPDFDLLDMIGKSFQLQMSWQDRPALVLFWRHNGCSCGIDRARRLKEEYNSYLEAGANVVIVGQSEPERAAQYAQLHSVPCPILCDPTRMVYETYGLLEGKPSQVLFDAPADLLRCELNAVEKFIQSREGTARAIVDSPWQLPGEFVVDRSGIIRLAYRYQYCEDWPNPLVLIAALREAAGQL
ncbi:MAG TPA: peroxiredoxin-like family protein [Anaerolineae bacterium]|nr:peroxiredoxin-like family protein [Anaerolineae bacterium]